MNNEFTNNNIENNNSLMVTPTNTIGSYPYTNNICCRVVCYLDAPRVANWYIITEEDGTVIYESGTTYKDEIWTIDLNALSIVPETALTVKLTFPDHEIISHATIYYMPDSNATGYFEYNILNNEKYVAFYGTIPVDYRPNAEPYLNTYEFSVYNDSGVLTKYALYGLNGAKLYESANYAAKETWRVPLQEIGLKSGDVFTLKALVYAGEDSTFDSPIRYLSNSKIRAEFKLHGTTTKNVLMYQGFILDGADKLITVLASNIVAYNLAGVIANWQILMLDGTTLYSSGNQLQYDTWKFNLEDLGIEEGTLLRLKIVVDTRTDHYAEEFLKYTPSFSTLYYEYIISGGSGKFYYNGSVSTINEVPLLRCPSISATHSEYPVIMKWQILDAKSGNVLLVSGRCAKGNTWNYPLKDLNVAVGTLLKVKAFVRAGADSEAYILLEYDPTGKNASFGFYGNAFKTIVPYRDR